MNVCDVITKRIIEKLEGGTVPWRRPWNFKYDMPLNIISGRPYRGINVFILLCQQYESPWWISFKQARKLGGAVTKGERGTPVVFWNWMKKATGEVDERGHEIVDNIPFLRYYTVFNSAQCEGIDVPEREVEENSFSPIECCERTVDGMPRKPIIKHIRTNAYYSPKEDIVNIPRAELFKGPEEYYSTFFHELVHSTGHESRLSRKGVTETAMFGSDSYSREELVAEMGAAFLCGYAGIENRTIDNTAAYIQGWVEKLKEDSKAVITAAAQAHKAFDFILNRKEKETDGEDYAV